MKTLIYRDKFNRHIRLGIAVVLALLFVFTMARLYMVYSSSTSRIVTDQIAKLVEIFNKIDATAGIVDFEHEKNYIDFLTIKTFVGSEVGALNLRYPEKWQGPYLDDNPTIQEELYVIIKNKDGNYIVPGDGVRLSNGKVMGKDIVITYDTDIEALMRDPQALFHEGRTLAARIGGGPNGSKIEVPAEVALFGAQVD